MKPLITYDDFAKMDFRVGFVTKCERKEDADKLLRLTVDFGEEEGTRTILSSLYPAYQPEDLQGKQFIFVINLEPRKFLGELSHGMILCADGSRPEPAEGEKPASPAGRPLPLIPQEKAENGAAIT